MADGTAMFVDYNSLEQIPLDQSPKHSCTSHMVKGERLLGTGT